MNSSKYSQMLSENPDIIPYVPAPPGKMAWSGSNNLGNVVNYAPDSNNRQSILKMDEWGPPESWVISLGMEGDDWPSGLANPSFEVEAEISFGVGGSTQEIRCSWLQGTVLCLPMNAISITAEYSTFFAGLFSPIPNLRLSAQIARGYHESNALLAVTGYQAPAIGSVKLFDVPQFAKQLKMLPIFNYSGAAFYSANNTVALNIGGIASPGLNMVVYKASDLFERWIDIPPYVRTVQYDDADGTNPTFHLLWKLGV